MVILIIPLAETVSASEIVERKNKNGRGFFNNIILLYQNTRLCWAAATMAFAKMLSRKTKQKGL